jgi:hypothetical protein
VTLKTKDLCDRRKALAKRGFGCTAYQVSRVAFIFSEKQCLKHPWGSKRNAGETGSLPS